MQLGREQRFCQPQFIRKWFRVRGFLSALHSICTQRSISHTSMDQILTPSQVAERLQVKPSWVYEQTRERAEVRNSDPLPHIKMGRYLRFDWYGRWREDVFEDGQVIRKQVSGKLEDVSDRFRSKADVRPLLADKLRPLNEHRLSPESTLTLAQYAKDFY